MCSVEFIAFIVLFNSSLALYTFSAAKSESNFGLNQVIHCISNIFYRIGMLLNVRNIFSRIQHFLFMFNYCIGNRWLIKFMQTVYMFLGACLLRKKTKIIPRLMQDRIKNKESEFISHWLHFLCFSLSDAKVCIVLQRLASLIIKVESQNMQSKMDWCVQFLCTSLYSFIYYCRCYDVSFLIPRSALSPCQLSAVPNDRVDHRIQSCLANI